MSKTTSKQGSPESFLKDADYAKTSQFDKSHRQIKTLNDPRFGDIHILQNPQTRQVVAVREKKVTDKAEAGRLILAARNRMALNNPYLVNLLDYSVTKQSELCSSFYIIKYYFEYPRTDMRKFTQEREKNGGTLSSAELTHMLYQQNQALAYLQSQGMSHGDLQPLYVGYDPDRMESKLIDKSETLTNDAAIINSQKNRMISGQPLYMSPTMYSNLKKGNTKFQFDRNKEDAFALGLMLLEAGNGRSVQNIYDSKTGQVNQSILNQHLDEFNRRYGQENNLLASHVSSLTNFNEAARPSPSQVQTSLPPYEEVKTRLVSNSMSGYGGNTGGYENQTMTTTSTSGIVNPNIGGLPIGSVPSGTNISTRQIVQGGDTKTIITRREEMPVVEEDLFAFDSLPVQSKVLSWDPSLVQPKVVQYESAKYNFIPNPNSSQSFTQSTFNTSQVQANPTPAATANVGLFDDVQTDNTLFNTFGGTGPAKARGPAKVMGGNTLLYADQPMTNEWRNETFTSSTQSNQFALPNNFNRKAFGETVTGNVDVSNSQFGAPANNQFGAASNSQFGAASNNYTAPAPAPAPLPAPAPAPATTTTKEITTTITTIQAPNQPAVTTIQTTAPTQTADQSAANFGSATNQAATGYDASANQASGNLSNTLKGYAGLGNSNLNTSASTQSQLIPNQMSHPPASQTGSGLHHEFRLYDSTRTQPETIQGGTYSSPVSNMNTSYSSYTSSAPVTTSYTSSGPVTTTYTSSRNVVTEPVTTTYTTTAPITTTYTTAAPVTETIINAPITYTTGAPITETIISNPVTYTAAPIRRSIVSSGTTYTNAAPITTTYTTAAPITETVISAAPTTYTTSQPIRRSIVAGQVTTYQDAPVTTQYVQVTPTLTTLQAAPVAYTTYSQSNIPATQSYTITEAATRPSQVVYTQPTIIEAPAQTYTITTGDTLVPRLSSSQLISTSANPELQGFKYVGSYTDDKYATVRMI